MENLSNNNPHASLLFAPLRGGGTTTKQSNNNSNSQRLLLLLIFIFHFSIIKAQNAYNKLYTLQANASTFDAVAPHGNLGGCMAAATVVDSLTGIQAIRIARFDAMGNLQASNYFNIPDDTKRSIYVNYKAIARVHDNCYAMVGTVLHHSIAQYSFILLADSIGRVFKYKDVVYRDSINLLAEIKYDGWGHLIVGGYFVNKAMDSSYGLIYKFDTSLNLIWFKQYRPINTSSSPTTAIVGGPGIFNLTADSSGYAISGGARNSGLNSFKGYKCQSLIIKTDTAGTLQWVWASPAVFYKDFQSYIGDLVHTKDGGYLFTTKGHTYNSRYPADPDFGIELEAKQLIIKMDAARNKQWEIVIDDYFTGFGYVRANLIELEDCSFLFLGSRTTDSLGPNLKTGKLVLQHYSSKGVLLKQRIINKYLPRSVDDTHKESGGPIYDIKQTADKAFVLCGYYENKTTGAAAPSQRGWLLKLDSNLCLGVGDSQCMPSSIIEQPQLAVESFKVYPNPAQHSIHLSIAANELKVFNTLGQIVLQTNNISAHQSIPVSQLNSGLYFVAVFDKEKNKIGVAKFYKE